MWESENGEVWSGFGDPSNCVSEGRACLGFQKERKSSNPGSGIQCFLGLWNFQASEMSGCWRFATPETSISGNQKQGFTRLAESRLLANGTRGSRASLEISVFRGLPYPAKIKCDIRGLAALSFSRDWDSSLFGLANGTQCPKSAEPCCKYFPRRHEIHGFG